MFENSIIIKKHKQKHFRAPFTPDVFRAPNSYLTHLFWRWSNVLLDRWLAARLENE